MYVCVPVNGNGPKNKQKKMKNVYLSTLNFTKNYYITIQKKSNRRFFLIKLFPQI